MEEAAMTRSQFACLLALAATAVMAPHANAQVKTAQPVAMSSGAMELRNAMRELWADHVVWTRNYIVAAVAGDPSATSALNRLMQNQTDLGAAIAPYYGAEAGTRLTQLLKDHIRIAGEVVAAAKANDKAKLTGANARWHANAADIAKFLSGANPNWKRDDVLHMLNEHLALTTQEATLRLQKKWNQDAAVFDKIFDQAMGMADVLSDGVIRQFPARF
jgi:hypothetical protein